MSVSSISDISVHWYSNQKLSGEIQFYEYYSDDNDIYLS